jgi:hypothetical protein
MLRPEARLLSFSLQAPVHTLHFIFRVKINFFDFPLFHMHHNVNGGVEHSHNIAHIEHTADRGRLDKQPNTVKGIARKLARHNTAGLRAK